MFSFLIFFYKYILENPLTFSFDGIKSKKKDDRNTLTFIHIYNLYLSKFDLLPRINVLLSDAKYFGCKQQKLKTYIVVFSKSSKDLFIFAKSIETIVSQVLILKIKLFSQLVFIP